MAVLHFKQVAQQTDSDPPVPPHRAEEDGDLACVMHCERIETADGRYVIVYSFDHGAGDPEPEETEDRATS